MLQQQTKVIPTTDLSIEMVILLQFFVAILHSEYYSALIFFVTFSIILIGILIFIFIHCYIDIILIILL